MFLLQRINGLSREEFLFFDGVGFLIAILVFSLLNTAILRFAALTVVKPMPRLKTTFYISFLSWILLFIGVFLEKMLGEPSGIPISQGGSTEVIIDSPLIKMLPLVFYFVGNWLLNSRYLIRRKIVANRVWKRGNCFSHPIFLNDGHHIDNLSLF